MSGHLVDRLYDRVKVHDRRALARHLLLGLALGLACQSALAQAMYRIVPLRCPGRCTSSFYAPDANGFNNADEVAGTVYFANGSYHAFLWKNDGNPMIDLGPDKVGSDSVGYGLNASGQVTGSVTDSTGTFAFVSSGNGTPMKLIHDRLGGNFAAAYAINDLGEVTGEAALSDGTTHAIVWKNDGSSMRDLGALCCDWTNTAGFAINDAGQIAGDAFYNGAPGEQAFLWEGGGKPLRAVGHRGSAGLINASGQVAGFSFVVGQSPRVHAFLWRNDGTPIKNLGTLGGAESFPYALNDSGQVAGSSSTLRFLNPHAFLWMNDGTPMKDLGTLGGHYSGAKGLNAAGQVVGYSYLAGDKAAHTFLWRNDGGEMLDVNALIDPTDPLKPYVTFDGGLALCCAAHNMFINDSGDILSEGVDSRTRVVGLYLLKGTVLTLAPRSLGFGNQPIKMSGTPKLVTLTNTSPKVVAVTSIALTGTDADQFAETNNCGSSLMGHATCTIKATFKPTTKGAKSAFLNVNGGGGGLRTVALTGTGT